MAILIQGEKMPKNCGCCPCSNYTCMAIDDGVEVVEYFEGDKRRPDCPLTEIPEPHGRLIDADATLKLLQGLGNRDYRREKGTIMEAMKMLSYEEYTPTIIPATSEGEV